MGKKTDSPKEIDRWINTSDTEAIYEKYKVRQGITDFSTFEAELKASIPSAMASVISREQVERLFKDYGGMTAEEMEAEAKAKQETEEQVEREMEARIKELTHFSKEQLYKEPRIFKQRGTKGKEYTRKYQLWTPQQIRWLNSRSAEKNNKSLMNNFNKYFGTYRTASSIMTQKIRLRKKVRK